MGKPTGPTSAALQSMILDLRKLASKEKVPLWKRLAADLSTSTRRRREVNLWKLDKYAQENETMVVPGKVLGHGLLTKKVNVAALRYSKEAKMKIEQSGKAWTITQLLKENPKGKKIRIIG